MTKYILHGGNTSERNNDNAEFFREITSGLNGRVKILLNYFAKEEADHSNSAKKDQKRLLRHSKNKNLEFRVAEMETFESQLKWASAMYIHGGSTIRLMEKLKKIRDIEKLFEGKVIAGSSAGAYALSKYYWGNNAKMLGKGLGVLAIKCYCHCEPKDTKIIKKLMKYKKALPVILLPNCKMHIIHQ